MKGLLSLGLLTLVLALCVGAGETEAQRYKASKAKKFNHPTMGKTAPRGRVGAVKVRAIKQRRVRPRNFAAARKRAQLQRSRSKRGQVIRARGKFRRRP